MPFNGSGVYSLPTNSFAQPVNDTTIDSDDASTTLEDIATGLTLCLTEDGQNKPTANIDFTTAYKPVNIAAGVNSGDAVTIGGAETITGDKTISGDVDLTGAFSIGSTAVTSTAAELNILDGVTASATELNRSDLTAATGTVTAQENLTTDASKDIGTFNNVTSTTFTGALVGNADTATAATNADTVTTNANLTGDVTSVGNATTLADDVVGRANIVDGAAGIYSIASNHTLRSSGAVATVKLKEVKVGPPGTYRIYFTAKSDSTTGTPVVRLYKGGVYQGVEQATTTSYASYFFTITVVAGNLIQLYAAHGSGTVNIDISDAHLAVESPVISGFSTGF